ncbi:tail fiber domain-containing protein [Dyadobacter sp. CY343]|uniref:tail fiber domain-containing protein n=1 Tax=Dyadobacter sp. CY343 TaxID=2907299 RepID=UPI001F40B5EA|nr:tail fiber domain-containing protein [Dyadobacter sp. CY343]MCE7060282.1 tail fiber domain-containing protein [Dyadobacter sp. CY343]
MNILPKQHKILLSACTFGAAVFLGNHCAFAQVKVGENPQTINAGSVLEIESSDKGLLLPRISLANTTTWGLAGTPAAGMQVYNMNAGVTATSTSYPIAEGGTGVYYWDGSGWVSSKKGQSGSGSDFDWLKTSNNATPSDPADIGSAIYHGGAGSQEVTVRSNTVVAGESVRTTTVAGHGTAQAAATSLFAEYNANINPNAHPENNAVTGIQTTTQHPLIFRTTGSDNVPTERMRITPGGSVGIGTPGMPDVSQVSFRVNGPIYQVNSDVIESTQAVILRNGGITLFGAQNQEDNGYVDFKDNYNGAYNARILYSNDIGTAGALLFRVRGQNLKDAITILNSNGYVGINRTNPNYELDVLGDINATGEVRNSGTSLTSDARLKRNIQSLQNGLGIVSKLKPVSYEKKATIADSIYNKSEIGFIAQEVQKILPQLVREGKDADKTLALDYNSLIPILTKAIQEQQSQIEKLLSERATHSDLLNTQTVKLNAQENEINEIKELLQIKKTVSSARISK